MFSELIVFVWAYSNDYLKNVFWPFKICHMCCFHFSGDNLVYLQMHENELSEYFLFELKFNLKEVSIML